jgi:very-short-patch-repair endonuclease
LKTLAELLRADVNFDILNLHPNNHTRRNYINEIFEKELLIDMIETRGMSTYAAETLLESIGVKILLHRRAEKWGIKLPNCSEGYCRGDKKRKATNNIRYNGDNPLNRNSDSYIKRNETVKAKYGVDNVFQLEETKDKIKSTMLDKYGVENPSWRSDFKPAQKNISKPHLKANEFLTQIGINFKNEVGNLFPKLNNTTGKIYNPRVDIWCSEIKLVIEINGEFYHADPRVYMATDIMQHSFAGPNYPTAQTVWDRDRARTEQIKSFGVDVLILWEKEIKNNSFETIIEEKINEIKNRKH